MYPKSGTTSRATHPTRNSGIVQVLNSMPDHALTDDEIGHLKQACVSDDEDDQQVENPPSKRSRSDSPTKPWMLGR